MSADDRAGSADEAAAERVRAAVWARCAGQRGAWLDHPFGAETAVFKVVDKVFALVSEGTAPAHLSLKCEPEFAAALRETHPAVAAGYHLDKRHWITITLDGSVEGDLLDDLVDGSYDLVVAKLPKRTRDGLASMPGECLGASRRRRGYRGLRTAHEPRGRE